MHAPWLDHAACYPCTAEVYPALGGVDRGSISERGGRYAPEFLWNTNWKDQLELEQVLFRQPPL